MTHHGLVQYGFCIPFVFLDPDNQVLLDIIDFLQSDAKLQHNFHDLSKLVHVQVIIFLAKSVLEQFWCKVDEPEAP